MTRKKPPPPSVCSSSAEYLTFVAATGDQSQPVEMHYEDENLRLTQKLMATLYDVTAPAINQHFKRVFADRELDGQAVVEQHLTTTADGNDYQREWHGLDAVIAVDMLHWAGLTSSLDNVERTSRGAA